MSDAAAAIEAGVLEHALHQPVQGAAGGGDAVAGRAGVAVARQVGLVGEQIGIADDDVQRRAQLVRHVGDELGLQAVGLAQAVRGAAAVSRSWWRRSVTSRAMHW